jgi:hypothetical protein
MNERLVLGTVINILSGRSSRFCVLLPPPNCELLGIDDATVR